MVSTNSVADSLPEAFRDLDRFVSKWDREGTNPRYAERLSSSMTELEDFHDAVLARVGDIKRHLDAKSFADYSGSDRRLARLVFAWVPVAEAVEVFRQPRVPQSKMYWDIRIEPDL